MTFFDACITYAGIPALESSGVRKKRISHELERFGVAGALCFHVAGRDYDARYGNGRLVDELGADGILKPVFVLAPETATGSPLLDGPAPIVRYLSNYRVKGVIVFPSRNGHGFNLADWNIGSILTALESMGMPLFLDKGQFTYSELDGLLTNHPAIPVILRGVYYAEDRKLMPLMNRHKNLHVDSSIGRQYFGIEEYVEAFGAERVVFSSHYPESDMGAAVASITMSGLSDSEKETVASGAISSIIGAIRYDL